ncbi:hypothetical protein F5I97DRAFT_559407 [Phlebopus sp. FC_14]|nr:hypothetical protein F5I97DRAFT_559407 [Phlebopus sp. FC_14]
MYTVFQSVFPCTKNKMESAESKTKKSEGSFDSRMNSAFTACRNRSEQVVQEANVYLENFHNELLRLEQLHLQKQSTFQRMIAQTKMNDQSFDDLFSGYRPLLEELAPQRIQALQTAEEMVLDQSAHMRKSRKNIMVDAKRRLDEGKERQRLAADATTLIKHYKSLILAV